MLYYADRISDNIHRREPEGYLICVNVPIARSGTQQYQQDELGQEGSELVTVYRPEEEVFSKETMSSFEGMPVTNDHPDTEEGVTVDNVQFLGKGHCQNIRRGTGRDSDLLIADLVIQDKATIQEVLDGKREISCGYNYELCEEDGKLIQRQIRGNHIAIVDRGRAGHRVCIKDSAPNNERSKKTMAKANKNHIGILSKMLAALTASDAEPEEIEAAVDAIEDITSGEEAQATPVEPAEPVEKDEEPAADPLAMIMARLDKIEAALNAAGGADEAAPEEKDPLQELEDDLNELAGGEEKTEEPMTPDEDPEEQESHFVDPEEINEEDEAPEEDPGEEAPEAVDCKGRDALRQAIRVMKPIIATLPEKQRKQASDALAKQLRTVSGMSAASRNDYLTLKKAARKKTADAQPADADLAARIMAKRNPNYSK